MLLSLATVATMATAQGKIAEQWAADIHTEFTTTKQDTTETIESSYQDGEVRNGRAYFPTLDIAININPKQIISENPKINITTEQFDKIIAIWWIENISKIRSMLGKNFFLRNTETGRREVRRINSIHGEYTGELRERDWELQAVYTEYPTPVIEVRSYDMHPWDVSRGGYQLETAPLEWGVPVDENHQLVKLSPTF